MPFLSRITGITVLAVATGVVALAFVIWLFATYVRAQREDPLRDERELLAHGTRKTRLSAPDAVVACFLTAAYAFVAFFSLGDTVAPQSFCRYAERGRYVTVEFDEPRALSRVTWYAGYYPGTYYLKFSDDGEDWTEGIEMKQEVGSVFKWMDAELPEDGVTTRFLQIVAGSELEMGELALRGADGALIPASDFTYTPGSHALFDEQALVPAEQTFMNSTYFDEIYHARTAYENLRGVWPYEITHPPLGKILISIGVALFGMTPFGWRFIGTLFGALMLPILYVFLKKLFGRRAVATCGTLIFAFDFMHFSQTRIATIDTYAVFFIILMYFCMYLYVSADWDDPGRPRWKTVLPLFLSGLFFGLGAASKWTVLYGGGGLALIWLLFWIDRGINLCRENRGGWFGAEFLTSIGQCLVFFVVVPCLVYYMSYIPYGPSQGLHGPSMLFSKDYAKIVWDNQKYMWNYHSDLVSTHPYSSRWYQWLADARPILYYLRYYDDALTARIAAFLNPLLCWAGLLAMFAMGWRAVAKRDKLALFILLGYLAQLVPWIPVSRLTFAYHYFPSTAFLTMAVCYMLMILWERGGKRWPLYAFTGASVGLFFVFYPVLSGMTVPIKYSSFLQWIPEAWPF